jgi:hypothetical protein
MWTAGRSAVAMAGISFVVRALVPRATASRIPPRTAGIIHTTSNFLPTHHIFISHKPPSWRASKNHRSQWIRHRLSNSQCRRACPSSRSHQSASQARNHRTAGQHLDRHQIKNFVRLLPHCDSSIIEETIAMFPCTALLLCLKTLTLRTSRKLRQSTW